MVHSSSRASKPMKGKKFCIDCAHCTMRINWDGGSNYFCEKLQKQLSAAILWRTACESFEPCRN